MLKLNVLHLLAATGSLGTVMLLRREAMGRSLPLGRLGAGPLLALAAALVMLALTDPATRQPALWTGMLTAGLVVGTARGVVLPLQVDRLWDRFRLPAGRDGLWAAGLLGAAALIEFGTDLVPDHVPWTNMLDIAATATAAACAGFLIGRAVAVWLRSLRAPHITLRGP